MSSSLRDRSSGMKWSASSKPPFPKAKRRYCRAWRTSDTGRRQYLPSGTYSCASRSGSRQDIVLKHRGNWTVYYAYRCKQKARSSQIHIASKEPHTKKQRPEAWPRHYLHFQSPQCTWKVEAPNLGSSWMYLQTSFQSAGWFFKVKLSKPSCLDKVMVGLYVTTISEFISQDSKSRLGTIVLWGWDSVGVLREIRTGRRWKLKNGLIIVDVA